MKKKQQNRNWMIGLLVFAGLLVAIIVLVSVQEKQITASGKVGVPPGTAAPSFTLQSTIGEISLEDYKGKNVVLFFYEGNGCKACIDQLIELDEKSAEYAKQNTVVLAATTDPVKYSEQIAKKHDIQVPIIYDKNQQIGKQYGITDVPGGMDMGPVDTHSVFVINEQGTVSWFEVSTQDMYVPIRSIEKELQKLWQ